MSAGAQQSRIIVDNQIDRNILDEGFKSAFIFKTAAKAGGFEEFKEARHDTASNIHAAKGAEGQRQVTAKSAHNDAKQRQRAAAIDAGIGQSAFGHIFRLQIFR